MVSASWMGYWPNLVSSLYHVSNQFYDGAIEKEEISKSNFIIILFIIQIITNLMWPGVFNSAQYFTSFLMIILMVVFTAIYAYVIFEPAKNASILVWPYIIWVSFAGIINFAYYLNAR